MNNEQHTDIENYQRVVTAFARINKEDGTNAICNLNSVLSLARKHKDPEYCNIPESVLASIETLTKYTRGLHEIICHGKDLLSVEECDATLKRSKEFWEQLEIITRNSPGFVPKNKY